MSEWKIYRKKVFQEMRLYIPGENMDGISVSEGDVLEAGGMIGRNSKNHADQWYVAKRFVEDNYKEMII